MRITKRIVALSLCVIMMLGICPINGLQLITASSTSLTEVPDGYTPIWSVSDLRNIESSQKSMGANYILMTDLDLSSYGEWTPLGVTKSLGFGGTFDGNNHTISNLTITRKNTKNEYGLFGTLYNADFQNVILKNISINISSNVESNSSADDIIVGPLGYKIAGANQSKSSFKNCSVSGSITVNCKTWAYIGGICSGGIRSLVYFENIKTDLNIKVSAKGAEVGGVIDGAYSPNSPLKVTNCVIKGTFNVKTAGRCYVGGIVADNDGDNKFVNCSNFATIIAENSSGTMYVGGLSALSSDLSNSDSMQYCSNFGTIKCTSSSNGTVNIGGLSGQVFSWDPIEYKQCCNFGNIFLDQKNTNKEEVCIGGILGKLRTTNGGSATICDSYNTGNITVTNAKTAGIMRGIGACRSKRCYTIGKIITDYTASSTPNYEYFNDYGLENCYYLDSKICGRTPTVGTPLNSAQMKEQSNFTGFDFGTVWTFLPNTNYKFPVLRKIVMNNNAVSPELEEIMFKYGLPTLSDTDARAFLSFMFNKDFMETDVSGDPMYNLLVGNVSNLNTDELKGYIDAFLLLIQATLNKNLSEANTQNMFFANELTERLQKELGGVSGPDQEIFNEVYYPVVNKLKGYVKEGITDILVGAVAKYAGIYISESTLQDAGLLLNGANSIADIPQKVEKYVNRLIEVTEGVCFVLAQEKVGRYSYFNAYLINRQQFEDDDYLFETAMNYAELAAKNNGGFSVILDALTPFGKTSWMQHIELIDRWGEYIYSLGKFQSSDTHSWVVTNIEPTCTNIGYVKARCECCGETLLSDEKAALGHNFSVTTVNQNICEGGYYRTTKTCKRCGLTEYYDYIEGTGHTAIRQNVVSATCTNEGYTVNYCLCGYVWCSNYTSSLGHTFADSVVPATESEQGYTKHTCSVCGYEMYDNYTDPIDHQYSAVVVEPTCEEEGYTIHTCSLCESSYTDNHTDAKGHSYEIPDITQPTCQSKGTITYVCSECGDSYSEEIDELQHDYEYIVSVVEPTCAEQGYTEHLCACGEYQRDNYVEATGHNYDLVSQTEPTCGTNGLKTYKCSICGDILEEEIITDHQEHNYILAEDVSGTCLNYGYKKYTCSLCGDEMITDIVQPAGHTINEPNIVHATKNSKGHLDSIVCTTCGETIVSGKDIYAINWLIDGEETLQEYFVDEKLLPPDAIKEGYTFIGWDVEPPEEMPAECLTITAQFIPFAISYLDDDTVRIDKYSGQDTETAVPNQILGKDVSSISDTAFNTALNLKRISVSADNSYFTSRNGILYSKDMKKLIRCPRAYDVTDIILDSEVEEISKYAFSNTQISNVVLPSTIKTIRGYAFQKTQLSSITIPESVERIEGYAFIDCDNLSEVYYNALSATTGITTAFISILKNSPFKNDNNIKNVYFGEDVESVPVGLFCYLTGIETVYINGDTELTSVNKYAFQGCSSISDVYYGKYYKYWKLIDVDSNNTPFTDATLHCLECDECTWSLISATNPATCIHKGFGDYMCEVCEKEKSDEININPNNHISESTCRVVQKATCGKDGVCEYVCPDCGAVVSTGKLTDRPAHNYGSWSEWKETDNGDTVRHRDCIKCDHQQTQTIPGIPKNTTIDIIELIRIIFARIFAKLGIFIMTSK